MDDQRFDDIIKGKVSEYSDPTYDETAIAGLHQHLAAHQVTPWYGPYKGAMAMAATLAFFTLINWWLIKDNLNIDTSSSVPSGDRFHDYQMVMDNLREVIDELKRIRQDTFYIVRSSDNGISNQPPGVVNASISSDEIINQFLLRLKNGEQIGVIGDYYFYHQDEEVLFKDLAQYQNRNEELSGSLLTLSSPNGDTIYKDITYAHGLEDNGKMPIVVLRDLEKHYSRGLGLKLGVEGDFALSQPDIGSGEGLPGIGILGELVLSPSLGLETGFKYKTRSYAVESPNAGDLQSYPGIDPNLGTVDEFEGDAKLIEFPINLKYYRLIDQQKSLYLSAGLSPNLYLTQSFEYSQEDESSATESSITTDADVGESNFYLGTVNASVGMNFDLPKRRSIQLGLFYQKSLSDLGIEERSMNIFGVKSSYWFRVR